MAVFVLDASVAIAWCFCQTCLHRTGLVRGAVRLALKPANAAVRANFRGVDRPADRYNFSAAVSMRLFARDRELNDLRRTLRLDVASQILLVLYGRSSPVRFLCQQRFQNVDVAAAGEAQEIALRTLEADAGDPALKRRTSAATATVVNPRAHQRETATRLDPGEHRAIECSRPAVFLYELADERGGKFRVALFHGVHPARCHLLHETAVAVRSHMAHETPEEAHPVKAADAFQQPGAAEQDPPFGSSQLAVVIPKLARLNVDYPAVRRHDNLVGRIGDDQHAAVFQLCRREGRK
jgi:hypothetical protein